ncbi:MAG TPA: hypothetical protein VGQ46_19640 [Thermoanaerobaculia bacterium]|nr:hypothetical protein [Thermoanaerobaculia bacterium]
MEDLVAAHPGLCAFQLAGSYWNQASQLPDADIDLRRFGSVDRNSPDARVARGVALFEQGGRLVELAEWSFGDLDDPQSLSLRDAVSVVRAHPLWERGSWLSDRVANIRTQLLDSGWRGRKLDEAFARCEVRLLQLRAENQHLASLRTAPSAVTPASYFKHVFYTVVDELSGLISVLDFRPPSLARKALMEISDCLAAIQLSHITEAIYAAVGCADFGVTECLGWRDELESLYAQSAMVNSRGVPKKSYYITGITSMSVRGHSRAAAFPIWRGLDECMTASELLPPPWLSLPAEAEARAIIVDQTEYRGLRRRIDNDLERLRIRLKFQTDSEIAARLDQSILALSELRCHSEHLKAHLDERVTSWNALRS